MPNCTSASHGSTQVQPCALDLDRTIPCWASLSSGPFILSYWRGFQLSGPFTKEEQTPFLWLGEAFSSLGPSHKWNKLPCRGLEKLSAFCSLHIGGTCSLLVAWIWTSEWWNVKADKRREAAGIQRSSQESRLELVRRRGDGEVHPQVRGRSQRQHIITKSPPTWRQSQRLPSLSR